MSFNIPNMKGQYLTRNARRCGDFLKNSHTYRQSYSRYWSWPGTYSEEPPSLVPAVWRVNWKSRPGPRHKKTLLCEPRPQNEITTLNIARSQAVPAIACQETPEDIGNKWMQLFSLTSIVLRRKHADPTPE